MKEAILNRLNELVTEADGIGGTHRPSAGHDSPFGYREGNVDDPRWAAWRVACLRMISQVVGEGDFYFTEFSDNVRSSYFPTFTQAAAVLRRLRDDFAKGHVRDLRELAAAEVFGDFLDMALHLHEKGFQAAAVSITGAVLEDCLRRLHVKYKVKDEVPRGIDRLNNSLVSTSVYSSTQQKQISSWASLRNEVDHGTNMQPDPRDVKRMVEWVQEFVAKHEG